MELIGFFCKKFASSGIWTHNSNHHWIRILTALPTQPPRHLLNRKSLNWSWIISRFNWAWLYKGLKIWDWQGMTDWLSEEGIRILIQWWLVLWVQFSLRATFFAETFQNTSMSILYRNVRNARFVLKTITSIDGIVVNHQWSIYTERQCQRQRQWQRGLHWFLLLAELFQQLCSLNEGKIWCKISQNLTSFGVYLEIWENRHFWLAERGGHMTLERDLTKKGTTWLFPHRRSPGRAPKDQVGSRPTFKRCH